MKTLLFYGTHTIGCDFVPQRKHPSLETVVSEVFVVVRRVVAQQLAVNGCRVHGRGLLEDAIDDALNFRHVFALRVVAWRCLFARRG